MNRAHEMPTERTLERKADKRLQPSRPLYASEALEAEAESVGSVSVSVSIRAEKLRSVAQELLVARETLAASTMHRALVEAAVALLRRDFADEFTGLINNYRAYLRESLGRGEDPALQAALNRARLQERILASTSMVEQAQACELLGMSATNPSATMKRKVDKGELLRFTVDGRPVYPLFQFDVEGRRVYPAMAKLLAAKPRDWSDFRLLHWLTRPHLDFDSAPADALGGDEQGVLAAFRREIEPVAHG